MEGCQGAAERRRDPLETPLLLFFILSGAGWLWEVAFVGLSTGVLVNRGFLHGPWLPVYGVGGLLFLLLPRRMEGWTLAAACALAGGGLEYAVSLVLEALFHQRWWDYAGWPGSLSGRVCLASAAAFGMTYGTSMHALKQRANLQPGETLLVLGASGGVGLAAVEIGKAMGARVIAAASTPDKLAVAKAAGADELINYSEGSLREQLKALTGGQGVDVIYDPVGGELFEEAFRSIAWNGRMLVVGFASGSIPSLPANLTLLKGASLVGVFWGSFAQRQPQDNADNFRQLFAWHAEGKLKPLGSQRFPLERAGDAIDALGQRRAVGKVVVEVR